MNKRRVVLDTNILVSALWTPRGNAAQILELIPNEEILPLYDYAIMSEYKDVLFRPKFVFPNDDVTRLLAMLVRRGQEVTVEKSDIQMIDESDRKFFDVAKTCTAYLITGNKKHYPIDPLIVSPHEFLFREE